MATRKKLAGAVLGLLASLSLQANVYAAEEQESFGGGQWPRPNTNYRRIISPR